METTDILKHYGLSITESRKQILELFHASKGALAHADIEKRSSASFDRVTIYRTLQTFVEKGIIHTQFFALVDKDGQVRGQIYDGLKKDELDRLKDDISILLKEKSKNGNFVNGIFNQ